MLKSKYFQCFTNAISQIIFLDVVYFHLPPNLDLTRGQT